MPTADRLDILLNLDQSGARQQIAQLERRPLTVPLNFQGGRAGGRMPGGVRGLAGLPRMPGMGIAGGLGRYMGRGGAAQMILGGGMVAGMLATQAMQNGATWGQVIASGAMAVGSALMMIPSPYFITQIIGGAMMLGGAFGPKLWDYFTKGKAAGDPFDLGKMLDRFRKDVAAPPAPALVGEDKWINAGSFSGPFGADGGAGPARGAIDELQQSLQQGDLIKELQAIRRLLGRVVLQGA